ncbi:ATP-binding cassette subfamily B (plasmid) [Azospirillum sp. B510]|uniref:NHLP bacteriocin export ABC transporter permease/ATPase subunit n=1 Tax=Azospirillum sp. (strain B510) TaxID=137722 RepID=UPI0001C4BC88|nr:NHLP bacteriocin export ABC transporter permease/ATPase subunit [Azospirillum sp. B510]BAI74521.1 ATP-binding cassette subfamily B [Azospirillum sp. B510]
MFETEPALADFSGPDAELLSKIDGVRRKVGSNNPFLMDDPDRVWLVLNGHVDLYAVRVVDGRVAGAGHHLARVQHGEVMFGMAPVSYEPAPEPTQNSEAAAPGDRLVIRAIACMGSELFEAWRSDLERDHFDIVIVDWIDRWVAHLAGILAGGHGCRADVLLEAEPNQMFRPGKRLSAQRGDVIWVTASEGILRYLGRPELPVVAGASPVPVTDRTWLTIARKTRITVRYTPTLLFQGDLWPGLDAFHRLFMPALRTDVLARKAQAQDRALRRLEAIDAAFRGGLMQIAQVLSPALARGSIAADATDPLFAACRLVGDAAGVRLKPLRDAGSSVTIDERVRLIARESRINQRRVRLENGWYRRDGGPMLAFVTMGPDEARPAALLPLSASSYELVDVLEGTRRPVDDAVAATLTGDAHVFYRPFPDRPLAVREVLRFGARGLVPDFRLLLAMGLLSGLLALVVPMVTGVLFSDVIPKSDIDSHLAIVGALVMAALGQAAFETVRGFATLRVQGRMDASIQAAVWDRLLRLPTRFFRAYSTGDLADRANGVNAIREILTSSITSTALDAVFSLFSFALLFWYSWRLALVAVGLALVAVLATALLTWAQMPHQRAMMERMGRIEGLVIQMVCAIGKLRNSASEPRLFALWAREMAEQKAIALGMRRLGAIQQVVTGCFPVLASMAIFLSVMTLLQRPDDAVPGAPLMDVGSFLAFNSAFGQFVAALMSMTGALGTTIAIVPLYERVSPILKSVPETREDADDPGELTGDIAFRNVTFRYGAQQAPVLKELSWSVEPGEYVAFVGPSGAGKSTIVRLLLGFERPDSGGIYLDGKDLFGIDLSAVRRQIGVVMQNGRLMQGSLFDNIVGSAPLSLDDAWEAARAAGMEQDIRSMPMGMQTVLSEGASTLSGGQRQRLMIARALVRKPRILLLDEATSALDNHTQSIVNHSLDRLNMTRIVIAHRLSTIQNMHRIFVLDGGGIVEQGSFADLMAQDGFFAELARRQLVR